MRSGVVILNFNSIKLTKRLINKICNIQCIDHIVVVDNCSTKDNFDDLCLLKNDKVDVIKTLYNGGYAKGNNYGCRYLVDTYNTDIIFIANPDVLFDETFASTVIEAFSKYSDYFGFTGVMFYPNGQQDNNPYLHLPTFWTDIASCFAITRLIYKKQHKNDARLENKEVMDVEALPGSLFAIRANEFLNIGGFDENTFLYYEENILGYKCKNNNYKLGLLTGCRYVHDHSGTISVSMNNIKRRKIINETVLYYEKNYLKTTGLKLSILKVCLNASILDAAIVVILKKILMRLNKV